MFKNTILYVLSLSQINRMFDIWRVEEGQIVLQFQSQIKVTTNALLWITILESKNEGMGNFVEFFKMIMGRVAYLAVLNTENFENPRKSDESSRKSMISVEF